MKANQPFTFLPNHPVSPDYSALSICYLPIIGQEAFVVYACLVSLYDNGATSHTFSQLLNHTGKSMKVVAHALEVLSAIDLLIMYQRQEDISLVLKAPLSQADFLAKDLFRRLLINRIGEPAVDEMMPHTIEGAQLINKQFSDVFGMDGRLNDPPQPQPVVTLEVFQKLMERDKLRFKDDNTDSIALYHLSQQHQLSWPDLYALAKQTAVHKTISIERMGKALLTSQKGHVSGLTDQEKAVVEACRSMEPASFLLALKQQKGKAIVLPQEQRTMANMAEDLGMLDETINVIISYSVKRRDDNNLNHDFAMRVANTLSGKGVITAEEAIKELRFASDKTPSRRYKSEKGNIPEWSKEVASHEKTKDGQAQLEAIRKELLAMEEGE